MNPLAHGILGGLAAGIQGDVERRKEAAAEAKQMNLLRFQQQMQRDNYQFQDSLARDRRSEEWGREDEHAKAAALAKQSQLSIAGVDSRDRPVYADHTGRLVDASGNPYNGELYNKGAKPQPKAPTKPGWQTYTREDGMRIQYDPNNPQNQIEIGMTGTTGGGARGGLSDSQRLKAETELAEMMSHGVDEDNVDIINVYRRHLGMPPLVPLETDPGKEGGMFGIGRKSPTVEYVPGGFEDGNLPPQSGNLSPGQPPPNQTPEVLPMARSHSPEPPPEQPQMGGMMATQDLPSGPSAKPEVLPKSNWQEHPALTGSIDPFQTVGKAVGKGAENLVGYAEDTVQRVLAVRSQLTKEHQELVDHMLDDESVKDNLITAIMKGGVAAAKALAEDYNVKEKSRQMGQRQGKSQGLEQFIRN